MAFKNPELIRYLTDGYEKEKWLRMNWVNRHTKELERATLLNREPTHYTLHDIQETLIVNCLPALTRGNIEAARNRRKPRVRDIDLVELGKAKNPDPVMKPVPEKLKQVLYTDNAKDYLQKRKLLPPDKKYNFLECTSWSHGWNFDKSAYKLRPPGYGKRFILTRLEGLSLEPDPPHYFDCKEISDLCTQVIE